MRCIKLFKWKGSYIAKYKFLNLYRMILFNSLPIHYHWVTNEHATLEICILPLWTTLKNVNMVHEYLHIQDFFLITIAIIMVELSKFWFKKKMCPIFFSPVVYLHGWLRFDFSIKDLKIWVIKSVSSIMLVKRNEQRQVKASCNSFMVEVDR